MTNEKRYQTGTPYGASIASAGKANFLEVSLPQNRTGWEDWESCRDEVVRCAGRRDVALEIYDSEKGILRLSTFRGRKKSIVQERVVSEASLQTTRASLLTLAGYSPKAEYTLKILTGKGSVSTRIYRK